MGDPVDKSEFVEKIRRAREEWDRQISNIPPEGMQQAGYCGAWSLKDTIAHITWYEREMVNMLEAHAFVGSSHWDLPVDERNAVIFDEGHDLSLEQVLGQLPKVYAKLISLVEALTDEDLNNPARFPGMPLDWQPWQILASNTYEHYEEHLSHPEGYVL
jgi:hypothetical protein